MKFPRFGYIRYADDFIITAESKEDLDTILPIIKEWLNGRGLELNQEKTTIRHVTDGVNFLGFTIKQFKGKTLEMPQKEKVLSKLREIRTWLKNNKHASPDNVIGYLNPIIRGFGNYYKIGSSKRVLGYFDAQIFKSLWLWAKRRHPNKGAKWVRRKYFCTYQGNQWTFFGKTEDRRGKMKILYLFRAKSIPIERHVMVKGTSSPDDPNLREYWESRLTRYGKVYWEKGSKLRKVAENQKWKCPLCGEHLFNGEELHTHHKVRIADGGTDKADNLIHLHKACHKHLHTGKQEA